jgi:hypothetical protein
LLLQARYGYCSKWRLTACSCAAAAAVAVVGRALGSPKHRIAGLHALVECSLSAVERTAELGDTVDVVVGGVDVAVAAARVLGVGHTVGVAGELKNTVVAQVGSTAFVDVG